MCHRVLTLGLPLVLLGCRGGPRLGPELTVVGGQASNATVAIEAHSGRVLVAYTWKSADSAWTVQVAGVDTTGTLLAPVRVDDGSEEVMVAAENPPEVVAAPDGSIYVAWVGSRRETSPEPDDITIHVARSTDGGESFARVGSLPGAPAPASRANLYGDLAVAPDGSLYLSWLDLHYYTDTLTARSRAHVPDSIPVPESRVEFRVARSTDHGASFVPAPPLDTIACICCRSVVTAGPDGAVHALWRHVFPGSIRDFQMATSLGGALDFAAPARVHDDHWVLDGCPDMGPDAVVDGAGAVHVAWYTGAPGRIGLWYASSRDGGRSFSDPAPLLGRGHVSPSHVRLAAAGDAVYGAWEDRRGAHPRVVFGRPAAGRTKVVGDGEFPWIAAAGGRLAITWIDGDAVRLRVAGLPTFGTGAGGPPGAVSHLPVRLHRSEPPRGMR